MPFDEKMLQDAIGEIAPDEETLPIEQAKGPGFRRDALAEAIQQETIAADRRSASVAALNTSTPDITNPDQVASILKLARDSGYPAEGLLDGQSFKSISSEYMRGLNQHILNTAPVAARTLSADPWMAKIMSDSLENGAEIERTFRESGFGAASRKARKEADRLSLVAEEAEARAVSRVAAVEDTAGGVALSRSRALLSGLPQDVGMKLSGAAELYNAAARGLAAPIIALGGDTAREILETDIGFDPARTFLKNPGESLKAIGRALRGQQEGFDLDVLAGLGQFASQAAIYYASGGAAGAISNLGLMAQGADIMAGKTAKDDAEPWLRDLATVGGGGITAITEKLGMDVVFGKLAVPFSNKFAALASRVLIGGAAEGYQELGESLLQDVLRIHTTNPTAEIELAQAIKEGNVGFVVGAIARGAVEGMLHIKSRGQTRVAQSEAENMQELFRLAMDSKARARDPQTFEAFMQSVSEDATVFVDSATLATVLQNAGLDPDVLPSFTEAARAEAANVGPGVEIPVSELVTRLSGTPAAEAIVEHLRTDPDSPTLAEARAAGDRAAEFFQQEAERILNEQEQTDAFREAAQTVEQDLLTQLETVSPFGPQANKGYAALTGAFYTTIASRLGITPLQLRDGWTDAQGVRHRGYALQIRGAASAGQSLQQTPTATADTFTGAGVRSLLEQDNWTIMTAENPAAVELSPEENLARNAAFEAELQRRGISYTPVKGSYGRLENSFALWGLSAAQASALGQEFGQESVLTRHGLLYPDGTVERATGVTVHGTPPEDFFTTLPDGTTFTVDLDFEGGRVPLFMDAGLAQAAVFTPEEQAIADRFEDWAANDSNAVEAYVSRFGSTVDPDNAKELSPEYVADPVRMARVVHEGSSILAKRVYAHLLKTAPKGAFVAFSAGGGGSGKSETLARMVPEGSEQPGVLYDSVLGNYDSAKARIEQALAAGRPVRILYTNRPVMKAWRFALHRARVVPASTLAKAHQGASDTIRRLKAEYEGDDQVSIFISNNLTDNLSDLALGTIDDVYSYDYNEVVAQLEAEARRQYEEGQIDEARFRAATGAEVGAGNGRIGQEGIRGQVAGTSGAGAGGFAQSATERLTRPPRNEDGSVTLWHYGKVPALSELDPAMSGQGIAGADTRRRDADPDNWSPRTYYGLAVGQPGGYVKESGLGDNLYSGNIPMSRLYDMAADPDGLRPAKAELSGWDNATSVYETRIKNAGYAGYWVSNPQLGLTAAVFEKVPVTQAKAPATLSQQQGTDRGSFSPETLDLALLANADLSTFLHETGHFFLTVYSDLALSPDVPAGLRDDMQKLLDWFGPGLTPETWATMTLEQQRPYHEQFAESFEQYLFSGQAPRAELAPLFRRFASWLTKVYSSLTRFVQTNKGAKLNPEIAAVMGRMLATDEEIAAAKQAREYSAFFASAAEAGMSPADFAAYLSLDEDTRLRAEETLRTRGLRDMQWLQNRRNKTLAELQKQAAARRKEVRAAVEAEARAAPLYRAIQWLKTGETTQEDGTAIKAEQGFKLSIPDLEAMFPEGALVPGPNWRGLRTGKTGMLAKEGLHPDLVADMFGFRSGEDLVRQLVDARPIKDEIEGLTDQRMLEQYGDLSSPEALNRAADEALHNEARTRMVATELSALKAAVGSPRALMKAAREYAEQLIGRRTSKTLRPWEFAAAELRAGKAALEALRSGDRELAAKHKRAELLNHSAAKAAHAAVAEIERTVSRLRDIAAAKDDSSRTKSRDMDTVNAVRVVLAAYGFGTSARTAKAHTYVDALKHNNPEAGDALGEIITTLTDGAKDWRSLTVAELRDLRDGVNALWSHARRSRQIEIDGKRIALADAVKDLRDTMARKGIPARAPGQGHAVTKAETRKMTFQTVLAKLRRVSQWADAMDGGPYGAFRRYIWYPIKDAADKYRTARAEYIGGKYNALLQAIAPELKPGLIDAREIGYVFGKGSSGVGKLELLHAVLHTGNASNKRKLLLGRGWATLTPDGNLDTAKWDAFMARMYREGVLQARDYNFAQGVWDLMEELKGGAQQAHRTVFGRYFDEVTAETVVTPFGAYRGGYVPATVDTAQVPDAALRQLAETENQNMQHSFPATQRGFTKARVEYNRPLALDLRVLSSHIDKVLLFTHMTPAVTDVHRLLRSEGVASDLSKIDAGVLNGMLIPWLNRSARQVVEEQTETAAVIDGVLRRLRRNMGMGLMFANVINTLQQFSGLALSSVKVKGRYLAGAAAHYASRPTETLEFVTAHSTFMHERLSNLNALMYDQVEEILVNPNVYEKAQNWSGRHAYVFQTMADRVLAPITWLGAYNQALESAPATMSEEGRETYARRLADSAVQETQMDQTPEGIAAFESGSAFRRMFTQFAGFFNMTANTMAGELSKAKALPAGQRTARAAYVIMFAYLIPAALSEIIAKGMRGGPEDEEGDGYLNDWLSSIGWGTLSFGAAMVPFAGQGINAVLSSVSGRKYDERVLSAPAIGALEATFRAPVSIYNAMAEDRKPSTAIRDTATAVAAFTGLPVTALAKPIAYTSDIATGYIEPTGPFDAIRGIITGTASPESK